MKHSTPGHRSHHRTRSATLHCLFAGGLAAALLLSACGSRRSVSSEDAAPDLLSGIDGARALDLIPAPDQAPMLDQTTAPDLPALADAEPPGCSTSNDCLASEYCHIDGACVASGAKMGDCTPRPTTCSYLYDPVCGCDGTSYPNPCAAHQAGTNVVHQGECVDCSAINQAFVAAVAQAKTCCPQCAMLQCTTKAKSELACPCTTFVEQANQAALKQMAQLEAQWTAKGCGNNACPPMPCPAVTSASCGFGATPYCYDQ